MTQHSIRQAKRDELAFPVRVKIRVPDTGLGTMLDRMMAWLRANVPAANFACHSAPGLACSTAAFYFRNVETAQAFVSAFPDADLADGLASPAYSRAR
ncbi:hypothetical protein GVM20_14185 [Porphyrobacter sp. SLTP]|uniref:hypothetical protein n=1 Tax=Porphyrobacter sp. SLTP TaxID=2683266 RepID=UPI0014131866|nr:hypothetical protein [Porphyrobacter sp. SLTP]NBB26277.1 hypothetical protein [Porphyrobacter sp. SLTP]